MKNFEFIFNKDDRCYSHGFFYNNIKGRAIFDKYQYGYNVFYKGKSNIFFVDIDMCNDMFLKKEYKDKLIEALEEM